MFFVVIIFHLTQGRSYRRGNIITSLLQKIYIIYRDYEKYRHWVKKKGGREGEVGRNLLEIGIAWNID